MNAKLFLEYLPFLIEPRSKLEGLGLDFDDYLANCVMPRISPISREKPIDFTNIPKSLRDLFEESNIEKVDLLHTFFWSEPKQLEQGWGFADMSEVNIVVAPSGRIEAYIAHPIRDMPGATDCLGVLAKDLESYLEALFYAQFNKVHFISGFPDEDPILYKKTVLVAKHCALIAGGEEYYPVWASIIGLSPTDGGSVENGI